MNTLELLADLIAFDTTSARSNLALVDYVQRYLLLHGVESRRVMDANGEKANLYATIGPDDRRGIVLSGHTDVVPVDGQHWHHPPFELTLEDALAIGRGTADMKGFLAAVLAAVPAMMQQRLETPIHLAFSYDEEVGCLGVRRLLDLLEQIEPRPLMALIGEPTSMTPVIGHKGKRAYQVEVTGASGHSANTATAVNAVEYAARLITHINDQHRSRARRGPFDEGYRVPHTTLHTGTVNGGTALNIVPEHCMFRFEIRHLPGDPVDRLEHELQVFAETLSAEMRQVDVASGIRFTALSGYPELNTDPDSSAVQLVRELLNSNAPVGKVGFGTEAGLFSARLGIPSVVCGPGNIEQAHKPDEFIHTEQLQRCDRLLQRLIDHCRSRTSP